MFFSKPKSYLGVDLGAGGIKIVELREEKKRPVLHTYGLTSTNQDIHSLFTNRPTSHVNTLGNAIQANEAIKPVDAIDNAQVQKYAKLLKAVCAGAKTVSKTAVVSLPVSVLFHAVINLPPMKKEDLDKVLRAEVKKLLNRPVEEMVLDYQVLKDAGSAKTQRVLINAVPKELVMFYTQVFKLAGLTLESLEPESVALERSLIGRDQSVAMIVDMGAERTNFYIIDQSAAITHNSTELGGERINRILAENLKIKDSLVEQLKHDYFGNLMNRVSSDISKEKFLNLFYPVVDPIVKEIEYGFELYLKQVGNETKRPEKIILTGGASFMPYLADHISEVFKIKCYVGDPWGRVVYQDGLKPLLHQVGPRMSVALGLALRNLV
ncbi:MAG: pilus assembly protein PilM [Candidatus Magasanikbacteria bacterium]|nr:pilus assembly protein PilM [Candidatus Magasanikbacteria bacterium]